MQTMPIGYPNPGTAFQSQYPSYPARPTTPMSQGAYPAIVGSYYQAQQAPRTGTLQHSTFSFNMPQASASNEVLPARETVKSRLTTGQGMQVGLKSGLIAGLLGGVPIWAIERWVKEPNFIQQIVQGYEQVARPNNMKWTQKLMRYSLAPSLICTALVGAGTGTLLGGWMVHQTQKKLLEIHEVKQAQQQGTFTPKVPTPFQKLGLASMPVENPDMAFKDMLQQDLDDKQAFWNGAKTVLLAKVIPGLFGLGISLAFLMAMRKFASRDEITKIALKPFDPLMKLPFQPVLIAKLFAFPIIGGFIAKQIVPWMKEQLGLQKSLPYPTRNVFT